MIIDNYKRAGDFFIETINQINSRFNDNEYWLYIYGF